MSACTVVAADHAFLARLNAITATTAPTAAAATAAVCANDANLCCDVTKTQAIVKTEIDEVKATLVAFGTGASKIGSVWAKIASLVNSTAITGTTSAATALEGTTDSGATGAQWKAFATYTPTTFETDFKNFKDQAIGCFDYYSTTIQKIPCDACKDGTINARYTSTTSAAIQINQATANAWVAACNKVWYFMWKAGWFVQSVALLNAKKGTYTYTATAATSVYFNQPTVTIDTINTAFASCYPDAATTVTACTDAMRTSLVKAFVQIYGASTANIGRADTTFLAGTTSFASNGSGRRMLAPTTIDGTIDVTAGGFDAAGAAATAIYPPTSAVALTTTETAAWSSGYVSTTSSSSSSSTSTTKNAKVVIGTILSALFAIAFLN